MRHRLNCSYFQTYLFFVRLGLMSGYRLSLWPSLKREKNSSRSLLTNTISSRMACIVNRWGKTPVKWKSRLIFKVIKGLMKTSSSSKITFTWLSLARIRDVLLKFLPISLLQYKKQPKMQMVKQLLKSRWIPRRKKRSPSL